MYFEYYRTPRGFLKRSPNSNGEWTATSAMSSMNFPLLTYITEISPRPILLILYDRKDRIQFGKIADFFGKNLGGKVERVEK